MEVRLRMAARKADRFCESTAARRTNHEMDVVGHEAIRDDADAVLARLLAQEREIDPTVIVGEEHVLAVMTAAAAGPLRDVVLIAADHDPCDSWHEYEHSAAAGGCQEEIRERTPDGIGAGMTSHIPGESGGARGAGIPGIALDLREHDHYADACAGRGAADRGPHPRSESGKLGACP